MEIVSTALARPEQSHRIRIIDRIDRAAEELPDATALTLLDDAGTERTSLTRAQLRSRIGFTAARLRSALEIGDRALVLGESPWAMAIGTLAALRAGIVPVPCSGLAREPRALERGLERLSKIARDCDARAIIVDDTHDALPFDQLDLDFGRIRRISVDRIGPRLRHMDAGDGSRHPALIQYTSGSTSDPRGVMVSHENLSENVAQLERAFDLGRDDVVVSWLPLFHDMGLILGLLAPLCAGARVVLLAPSAFSADPSSWLRAISTYRGTLSAAPDFAYQLCARKARSKQLEGLDLRSWRVAVDGAEPVRASTLHCFSRAFEHFGFRADALCPAYGLAEATLVVATTPPETPPVVLSADRELLSEGRVDPCPPDPQIARSIVSSGRVVAPTRVEIVDPQTGEPLDDFTIGEIVVAGPSVALGYWGRAGGDTPFSGDASSVTRTVKTGDLGFLADGQLFVTGRCKDLVTIAGRNIYPQDVEHAAEAVDDRVRPGGTTAFGIEGHDEERLVLCCELREFDPQTSSAIGCKIRRAVDEALSSAISELIFVRPGTLPRTSSGKLRRSACRRAYLEGSLSTWSLETIDWMPLSRPTECAPGLEDMRSWFLERFSRELCVEPEDIDDFEPMANFGLGSLFAARIARDLEEWIGIDLKPTVLYDCPTLDSLLVYLDRAVDRHRGDGDLEGS